MFSVSADLQSADDYRHLFAIDLQSAAEPAVPPDGHIIHEQAILACEGCLWPQAAYDPVGSMFSSERLAARGCERATRSVDGAQRNLEEENILPTDE